MRVLNSGKLRKSFRIIYGVVAQFPVGESTQLDDFRIIKYVKSHPDLSIVEDTIKTEPIIENVVNNSKKKKKNYIKKNLVEEVSKTENTADESTEEKTEE